jgi:hypothetical protein
MKSLSYTLIGASGNSEALKAFACFMPFDIKSELES